MKSKKFECLNDVGFDYCRTLVDGVHFDDEDRSPEGITHMFRKAVYRWRQLKVLIRGPEAL